MIWDLPWWQWALGVFSGVVLVTASVLWAMVFKDRPRADPRLPRRRGEVRMAGFGARLVGRKLVPGDRAPDASLIARDGGAVRLSRYFGTTVVISVVPKLGTGICNAQTRRFNALATQIPGAKLLSVSLNRPSMQNKFCETEGIAGIELLSDQPAGEFGQAWGVLIAGTNFLARSVFVVAPDGRIAHAEICRDLADHPDYDKAVAAARAA